MSLPPEADLPLNIVRHETAGEPAPRRRLRFRKRYLLVLLIPVFMFSGGVIGMYYQPTALQKFYALTGLQPGGGSATPIALPPDMHVSPKCWWASATGSRRARWWRGSTIRDSLKARCSWRGPMSRCAKRRWCRQRPRCRIQETKPAPPSNRQARRSKKDAR